MKINLSAKDLMSLIRVLNKKWNPFWIAPCGTYVVNTTGVAEIPEGYELPKLNPKTGHAEYSDGTIAEHLELRKIPGK
jgi:hypothetical protein